MVSQANIIRSAGNNVSDFCPENKQSLGDEMIQEVDFVTNLMCLTFDVPGGNSVRSGSKKHTKSSRTLLSTVTEI